MTSTRTAAVTVAAVLGADCLLHLYWAATGSAWPAATVPALSRALLDADVPFTPPVLLPLAAALSAAAVLVLARAGLVARRLPRWLPLLGTLGVAAGTGVRALAGLVWLGTDDPASTFHLLNLAVYTPLCVLLCLASLLVLLRGRRAPAA
ncbi:DUF3995 domain-containing protein [Actinocatenispora rupis]|uniref:DUF3995 domain-containing protein n=1 Tax=Actinocatenispora rupis TaxID=519421 RepID=A0A8J3NG47_9ACTN|nr:DUF3995 domain-containing protein [Actinocatenispora rupis]GID15575.1 hypothetical protein Aru02nite_64640 [Actinocatenispora rupis]